MKTDIVGFDAPFWGALIAGALFVIAAGCVGLAAAAQDAARGTAAIVVLPPT